ncbi:hypothetical protein T492DRAFT_866848 [Pavlovales sp. CCMP2436]|nr:hypothetical protein T492DRAFT_866848 [Pavlovales sp. CCMP2436]
MEKSKRALARIDNTSADEARKAKAKTGAHAREVEPEAQQEEVLAAKRQRAVRIVEHQSQSGIVYRRPVEHLQSAQLQMGASSLDIPNDAVLVANVFKDPSDWSVGEIVVSPMAVKPWRRTLDGTIAMRVIEGSAWLAIEPDEEDVVGEHDAGPSSPVDEARMLCQGDWLCVPPHVCYQITGAGLDAETPVPTPAFRAVFFARVYSDEVGSTKWDNWYEGNPKAKPQDARLAGLGEPASAKDADRSNKPPPLGDRLAIGAKRAQPREELRVAAYRNRADRADDG